MKTQNKFNIETINEMINGFNENTNQILLTNIVPSKVNANNLEGVVSIIRYKIEFKKVLYWLYINYGNKSLYLTDTKDNLIRKETSKEIFENIFKKPEILNKFNLGKNQIIGVTIDSALLKDVQDFLEKKDSNQTSNTNMPNAKVPANEEKTNKQKLNIVLEKYLKEII